jgi:ubiquinone/menaquinone biosynthesis C-methylase UbiE
MTETFDPFWKTPGDAKKYDEFTRTTFASIYPIIADQILERTGITKGACLDLGSGPAPLALALAWLSDLQVTALDSSPEMFGLARKNIRERRMEHRVVPMVGDVHAIPSDSGMFDLVVSRGSYHFWADLPAAFHEIHRVMKPGGMAYIGGGYGSARIRDEVLAGRKERGIVDDPDHPARARFRKFRAGEIEASIESAGIRDYRIISDDTGFWIVIRKGERPEKPE